MAVFRNSTDSKSDRSARDRARHRQLIRQKIREGIADIIAEESIIGQSKNKKIKVPIKGLKEYKFIYGFNKGVGTGKGGEKRGDKIGRAGEAQQGKSGQAGSMPGEDIYETEVDLEELINIMFEDLQLPNLEKKKYFYTESPDKRKIAGYKRKGIPAHLAKKKTLLNRLRRKNAYKREGILDEDESFPFHQDDLRYRRRVVRFKKHSNAVVICIMDTSGSMDVVKKYLARSFYFMLYRFIKIRYKNTDLVFIAHHTEAKEVDENEFFHKVESGGTFISSGYLKALEIIEKRYNPEIWNIYVFHCSDGDNWPEDNEKAVKTLSQLIEISNLVGYGEIKPNESYSWSSMIQHYKKIEADNFITLTIRNKEDLWPSFKKFLKMDKDYEELAPE